MEFNINDKVRVKLTDHGRKILKSDHDKFWKSIGKEMVYTPPEEDSEGWSTCQLWILMQKFGSHMYLGGISPFETTIEIKE